MPYSGPRPPALPRRRITPSSPQKQPPVFHFNQEDGDSSQEDDHAQPTAPSKHSLRLSFQDHKPFLTPNDKDTPAPVHPHTVPFPRSSPTSPSPPHHEQPLPGRSSSHPIFLSNGKPLKSSLKSSFSQPDIPTSPRSHQRACSAPSTPGHFSITTPKNVHFAEKDGLATVRVFNRSARPAALLRPISGDDTETETDSEFSNRPTNGVYPFPRIPASSSSPLTTQTYEIDRVAQGATSPIPALSPPLYANIHVETIDLSYSAASSYHRPSPILSGTLLVRNIAFEKSAAIRFTLDDWQTTSEVLARHVVTLEDLPQALTPRTPGDAAAIIAAGCERTWDRFSFTIRLEDYATKLDQRVMWFVARFNTPSGEWWDNNSCNNYRVAFRHTFRRAHSLSTPGTLFICINRE